MKRSLNHGFSLIELMVVIAIIGLLAAIAVPRYELYVDRTKIALAFNLMHEYDDRIIQAYNSGTFDCNSSFSSNVPSDAIRGLEIKVLGNSVGGYGPFTCGDKWIASTTMSVNGLNTMQDRVDGHEIVCILAKSDSGIIEKICGIYTPTFEWQVDTDLLPNGSNCLLSNNLTTTGEPCSNIPW